VQGTPAFVSVKDLPPTDLAILAIPAASCTEAIRCLVEEKETQAIIIVSAGFAEEDPAGGEIERKISALCRAHGVSLIGPNCIGVMTPYYQGVFTLPIPPLDPSGVDFISGSGATAVFIMESGLQKGLRFNHVFSVGNSALLGVEDVLAHLDETYEEGISSRVKILYFETIGNPEHLLTHARSLIRKGCRIAAVKAGTTDAGSRAASSHTGAMASSDIAVDALFRKAGIIRCYGREDLTTMASVMLYPPLTGKNLGIITHAGGPAVMLTDVLSKGGLDVPKLEGPKAAELLQHLFPGSSTANPIDILATGNAEQVGISIDYCERHFPEIDGIVVIFGTPGLVPVFDVYDVLHDRMEQCRKPIFPVLPSVTTAAEEVRAFTARGHVNFPDEVRLGEALVRLKNAPAPAGDGKPLSGSALTGVRKALEDCRDGFLEPVQVGRILDAAGIPRVSERVLGTEQDLDPAVRELGFPLVMKVVGPVHKSDVGGVVTSIRDLETLGTNFRTLMKLEGAKGVLLQPMLEGMELYAGAKYEPGFGHVVLCGPGGIFVEILRDVASGLAPLSGEEATAMIRSLRSYPLMEGYRGQGAIDPEEFARILVRLSAMLRHFPEVAEIDLNPLIGKGEKILVADARIRIAR